MLLASTAYGRPLDPRFSSLATRSALEPLDTRARLDLAAVVSDALGPAFAPGSELAGAAELPSVLHRSSGLFFVAIPGGEFVMGMSPAEIDEVAALFAPLGRADEARDAVSWASRPTRRVRVLPFLCAVQPSTDRVARAFLGDRYPGDERRAPTDEPILLSPRAAAELRGALGFRLLAEAEWEWVAREGGTRSWLCDPPASISFDLDPGGSTEHYPNAFGVLHAGLEFVADAWRRAYEGAPPDAIAWKPRAIPDHARGFHGSWQDELEAIRLHAGVREGKHGDDEAAVRFAIDLP